MSAPRDALLAAAVILTAAVLVLLRVLSVDGAMAGNDRSRWLTVRAVLETGHPSVGLLRPGDGYVDIMGIVAEEGWHSEDVVVDPATGEMFSSKPPFYAVSVAGFVAVVQAATGWRLKTDETAVVRATLTLVNVVPFLIALAALASLFRRLTDDPFARVALTAAAAAGTFYTTFQPVLTNHTASFAAVTVALYAAVRAREDARRRVVWLLASGAFAGFAAAVEPPALAFTAGLFVVCGAADRRGALVAYAPAACVPLALFALTNLWAWGVPYPVTFRSEWFEYAGSWWSSPLAARQREPSAWRYAFHTLVGTRGAFTLTPLFGLGLVHAVVGYGAASPAGAERAMRTQALVVLPIAVLVSVVLDKTSGLGALALAPAFGAAAGLLLVDLRTRPDAPLAARLPALALSSAAALTAFLLSYTNNYGGTTVGGRWWIWTGPLWLLCAALAARHLSGRTARVALGALVVAGVVIALEAGADPWRLPLFVRALGHG